MAVHRATHNANDSLTASSPRARSRQAAPRRGEAECGCCNRLRRCHALAGGFEAGDEARQRVRCRAARQHHLDQRKLPAPLDRAIERSGELAARGDPFAHAADEGRDIGKMPVIQIVEARFRLEHPQHLPALVVEQDDDRIEPVAPTIAELPAGHLEGAEWIGDDD